MGDGSLPWMAAGFSPGSVIAGYRLEKQIGRGGMAVVFRARDERLNRQVALKILSPALAADKSFRHRFVRESQAAAAVDDPNIIPVFEAGEAGGVLFIAMRLVRGGDIKTLVAEQGPLPPARAEWIVSEIASALDAAHAHGLVHRDVKPHNMLLEVRPGRPDHVYLSDFGLSKASVGSSGLTGAGQFLGTVDYCAPEQIQGEAVDGRADQYALGCTAYELLCGEVPFARDHGMAALFAHLSAEPPKLTAKRSELPSAVDLVFAKVLAKDAADRYPTCQEFADALRRALGVHSYALHGLAGRTQPPGEVMPEPAAAPEPVAPEEEPAAAAPARKRRAPRRRAAAAAPAQVAPAQVAPVEVAPVQVAPVEVAPVQVAPVEVTPAPAAAQVTPAPAAAQVAPAPAAPAEAGEVSTPDPGAVLTADDADVHGLTTPPEEPGATGDLHPGHPSHPSQLVQTTNLRTIRVKPGSPPAGSEQETEFPAVGPGKPHQVPDSRRPGGWRRGALIAAAVIVVAGGGTTALLLRKGPSAKPPLLAASQAFPQQQDDGAVAVRHWTLSGHGGSVLTDTVTITNPTGTARLVTYDEPVPGAITSSLVDVHFTPAAQIVDSGRAAQWKLQVPAHGQVVVGYTVTVPADGVSKARLARWAGALAVLAAQLNAKPVPPKSRVVSLTVAPHHLSLAVGATGRLKVTGLLAGGKAASAAGLSAVTWTSSDSSVATVNRFGKVSAVSAGTTHVTASIGVVSSFAEVVVTSLVTPSPGTNFGSSSQPGPGPKTTPPHTSTPTSTPTVTPTTLPAIAPATALPVVPAVQAAEAVAGRKPGDLYGLSLAMSGSVAIVGAPGEHSNTGAAYIYVRAGSAWRQQARIAVTGAGSSAAFGETVGVSSSLAGTFAVVGDPFKYDDTGVTYVFARSGRAWYPQATLADPAGTLDDDFGGSVAVSGTTAVIAAPFAGNDAGVVYIYSQFGRSWLLQATLADPHGPPGETFGSSVAVAGNTVIVAAVNAFNGTGRVFVYTRSGTRWSLRQKISSPLKASGGAFGADMAISGNTAVISAPGADHDAGLAYVFVRSGPRWVRRATLADPGNKAGDEFGAVAISGSRILIGATRAARNLCGTAYEFALAGNNWRERAHVVSPRCAPLDFFGDSVALSGSAGLVGADGTDKNAGAAYFSTLR